MASRSKYGAPSQAGAQTAPGGSQEIGSKLPDNKNPLLLQDGTLEVENLKERSSDGLSYHLDEETDKFYMTKSLDANTECQYVPKNIDKVYKTTVSFKDEIKEAYAVYKNDVKKFAIETLTRYKKSPKPLKKEIDKLHKNKNQYMFTEDRNGTLWNQPYIDSTMFGPYNYDVRLHVTKDLDFINDLIVIKSGSFELKYDRTAKTSVKLPSKNTWGIAWVSPHRSIAYTGSAVYTLTGTTYRQGAFNATGSGVLAYLSGVSSYIKDYHVSNAGTCHALSSRHLRASAGQYLHTGTAFTDTTSNESFTDPRPLAQDFYYTYDNKEGRYSGRLNTGGWDGVIPSGSWFSIETWSTNPRYIGFDGEISVKPTGATDPTFSYTGVSTGTASDFDYQQSVRKAITLAKTAFHQRLNKILVSKGIRNKNARTVKYDRLIERVAQNAYDGLSMVRNETIAKVQGQETNPLGGPVYYDGTSKQFGGSNMSSDYNTTETYFERNTTFKTKGGTGSSSSAGSAY
jgi:hypothetical protein